MRTKTKPSAKTSSTTVRRSARVKPAPTGYSGTALPKKLGIHPDSRVGLLGAPPDFEALLEPVPEGVTLSRSARSASDLCLWFPRDARELRAQIKARADQLGRYGIWICWPKKASGVPTDLSEELIRNAGLAVGLVDFKVCAIDATYSGLKLTRRKSPA